MKRLLIAAGLVLLLLLGVAAGSIVNSMLKAAGLEWIWDAVFALLMLGLAWDAAGDIAAGKRP